MSRSNVKISFNCNVDDFMEIKENNMWFLNRIKVVINTEKMRRKEGWVYKLESEIICDCDGADIQKNKDSVILDIWCLDFYEDCKTGQEECYKFAIEDSTYREDILKKFRIKNYEIIYEFESNKRFIERIKEALEKSRKDSMEEIYYQGEDIENGEEPF